MKKFLLMMLTALVVNVFGQFEPQKTTFENPKSIYLPADNMDHLLYDQLETPSSSGYISNYDLSGTITQQVAENFTVPSGETWRIDSIFVYAHFFGASYLEVYFYDNMNPVRAYVPGNEITMQTVTDFEYTNIGTTTFIKIFLDPGVVLPEGEYWASILGPPTNFFSFSWVINTTSLDGYSARTSAHSWQHYGSQDLCFSLYGSPNNAEIPLSGWALGLGIFLIIAFTVIRLRRFS